MREAACSRPLRRFGGEVARDAPHEHEDEERGHADRDPASPVPPALRSRRLRPGPLEPARRPLRSRRCALGLAEGRHPPLDATSSVDAIGLLSLRHSAAYRSRVTERAIGIDVGGTKIAAGVIDRDGQIDHRVERPTPTESREEFLEVLDEIVDELRATPWPRSASGFRRRSTSARAASSARCTFRSPTSTSATNCRAVLGSRSPSTTTATRPRSPSGRSAPGRARTT